MKMVCAKTGFRLQIYNYYEYASLPNTQKKELSKLQPRRKGKLKGQFLKGKPEHIKKVYLG